VIGAGIPPGLARARSLDKHMQGPTKGGRGIEPPKSPQGDSSFRWDPPRKERYGAGPGGKGDQRFQRARAGRIGRGRGLRAPKTGRGAVSARLIKQCPGPKTRKDFMRPGRGGGGQKSFAKETHRRLLMGGAGAR